MGSGVASLQYIFYFDNLIHAETGCASYLDAILLLRRAADCTLVRAEGNCPCDGLYSSERRCAVLAPC